LLESKSIHFLLKINLSFYVFFIILYIYLSFMYEDPICNIIELLNYLVWSLICNIMHKNLFFLKDLNVLDKFNYIILA
jgi:hypothetical protein